MRSASNESAYLLDVDTEEVDVSLFRLAAMRLLDVDLASTDLGEARAIVRSLWPDPADVPYPTFADLGEDTSGYESPVEISRAELVELRQQVDAHLIEPLLPAPTALPESAQANDDEPQSAESVSILLRSGRLTRWATGVGRAGRVSRRRIVAVGLFVVSGLVVGPCRRR